MFARAGGGGLFAHLHQKALSELHGEVTYVVI